MPNLTQSRQAPDLVALGRAIRDVRRSLHMSQEHLALLADVDRSYVGRIERGDNNAAVLTLLKIARALNMKLSELADRAEL